MPPDNLDPAMSCQELNQVLRTARPTWSEKDLLNALDKLQQINIRSLDELRKALAGQRLNKRLKDIGLKSFTADTLQAIRAALGVEGITPKVAVAGGAEEDPSPPDTANAGGEAPASPGAVGTREADRLVQKSPAAAAGYPPHFGDGHGLQTGALPGFGREVQKSAAAGAGRSCGATSSAKVLGSSGLGTFHPPARANAQPQEDIPDLASVLQDLDFQDIELRRRAETEGIPTQHFENPDQWVDLLVRLEKLHVSTASKLAVEYEKLGFAADDLLPREEIRLLVKDALIWERMPSSALVEVCTVKGLHVAEDQSQSELLQLLKDKTWEAMGIPVQRFSSLNEARRVLQRIKSLENCKSIGELEDECRQWSVPLGTRAKAVDEVSAKVKQILIWNHLPLKELRRECKAHALSTDVRNECSEDAAKTDLIERLTTCMDLGGDMWKAQGVPVERLGSVGAAEALLRQLERLEAMGTLSLRAELRRMQARIRGLTLFTDLEDQALVDLLTQVIVWDNLPLPELRRECVENNVESAGISVRLINKLLERQCRIRGLEAAGVPRLLLEDEQTAELLFNQHQEIEKMGMEELTNLGNHHCFEHGTLGVALQNGMDRNSIVKLLKKLVAWEVLSLAQLQEECALLKLVSREAAMSGNEEEQQHVSMNLLIQHERLQLISAEALGDWCKDMCLQTEGIERKEMQDTLEKVMAWLSLTPAGLAKECATLQVADDAPSSRFESDEHRSFVVNELLHHHRCSKMSRDDLVSWYEGTGLSLQALQRGSEESELRRLFAKLLGWSSLPPPALQQECASRGLAAKSEDASSDDHRCDILDSLFLDEHMSMWQEQGFEARRIGNFEQTMQLVADYKSFAGRSDAELKATHVDLGLPYDKGLRREDFLRCLKTRLIWESLPMPELQEECRQNGLEETSTAGSDEEKREELVARLTAAASLSERKPHAARAEAPHEVKTDEHVHEHLRDGMCLYINLERRADRRERMETLAAPHEWLRTTMQRLPAVDGRGLDWLKLVSEKHFTRAAAITSQKARAAKLATLGATPKECSTHLTLGGCGCALSHRKAWQALVDSGSGWALILEDDITRVCGNFDRHLEGVMRQLPASWNLCYLGYHTGSLLAPGMNPKLQELNGKGWLPGLWGYLISRACAALLLQTLFPLDEQVDTAVGVFMSEQGGTFMLQNRHFLLFSPPTENSMDTDVQTFPKDMH